MIPYSTQCIDDDDIAAVLSALKGEYITQGELVDRFERKLAEYLGVKFVVVFNSATSALNVAYNISGIDQTPIYISVTLQMTKAI